MKIAAALLAAGLALMWWGAARAAEYRRWEIVIFERPMPSDLPDRQRIYVISEAYPTKEDCQRVLSGVRIRAPNAKARCLPKED